MTTAPITPGVMNKILMKITAGCGLRGCIPPLREWDVFA
jgi:hypothetical protein